MEIVSSEVTRAFHTLRDTHRDLGFWNVLVAVERFRSEPQHMREGLWTESRDARLCTDP